MVNKEQKKILAKAVKTILGSPEFKGFKFGQIGFNIANGECKNYSVNQTILPEKT
jgi:hypothetical protein